jgi:hypothetical protein
VAGEFIGIVEQSTLLKAIAAGVFLRFSAELLLDFCKSPAQNLFRFASPNEQFPSMARSAHLPLRRFQGHEEGRLTEGQ